jgi:hypothetical protein
MNPKSTIPIITRVVVIGRLIKSSDRPCAAGGEAPCLPSELPFVFGLCCMTNSLSPRSGREHKAWGGAQRNPRIQTHINIEPVKRAAAGKNEDLNQIWVIHRFIKMVLGSLVRYRPLRGLLCLTRRRPGVPLRSTPGFMLPPASRVGMPMTLESLRVYRRITVAAFSDIISLVFLLSATPQPRLKLLKIDINNRRQVQRHYLRHGQTADDCQP